MIPCFRALQICGAARPQRVLLTVILLHLSTVATCAERDGVLNALMVSIDRDDSLQHRQLLYVELSRAAVGEGDYELGCTALGKVDDRAARFMALHRLCDDIAATVTDEEVNQVAATLVTWNLFPESPKAIPGEELSSFVKSLCSRGRCRVATRVLDRQGLPPNLEGLILQGRLEEATSQFKDSLGAANVWQAAKMAGNVYLSEGEEEALAFLRTGWPERESVWLRELALTVSTRGIDATKIAQQFPKEPRRTALGRACEQLRNWRQMHRQALKEIDLRRFAELMDKEDDMAVAKLLAAARTQGDNEVFDQYQSLARARLKRPLHGPNAQRNDSSPRRWALFKELLAGHLKFREFDELNEDIADARDGLGAKGTIGCFVEAVSRVASGLDATDERRLADALDSRDLRLFAKIATAEGRKRLPEMLPNLEDHLLERARLSLWTRLQDELYE